MKFAHWIINKKKKKGKKRNKYGHTKDTLRVLALVHPSLPPPTQLQQCQGGHSCLMNWDRRPDKCDQFSKGSRQPQREAMTCSLCYIYREHRRHPVVRSLLFSATGWHKHLIGPKSLRWERHMLGKWLKMGHGKGFRTFQEQSIQPASVLIYEICPRSVGYGCLRVCLSPYPPVSIWVKVLTCKWLYTVQKISVCVDMHVFNTRPYASECIHCMLLCHIWSRWLCVSDVW